MIAWGKSRDGSDDVAVFAGVAHWDGTTLTMRCEPESSSFVIPTEWLPRIQVVPEDLKPTLLGADYSFSVTVGDLEGNEDGRASNSTGLRWPDAE